MAKAAAARKDEAPLDPRGYDQGQEVDLSRFDADPSEGIILGSQMKDIQKRLEPFLAEVYGRKVSIAFWIPRDLESRRMDWEPVIWRHLEEARKKDPTILEICNIREWNGAAVWRGKQTGEVHLLCIQPVERRQQKRKFLQQKRKEKLQMVAPESPVANTTATTDIEKFDAEVVEETTPEGNTE